MPPNPKITKRDIMDAAIRLIRLGGISSLNARALARELSCSTQPIFRLYPSMDDVRADAMLAATERYNQFFDERIKRSDVPPYKASGMAYIQFAREETELFKLLFMRDRTGEAPQNSEHSMDIAVRMIMAATGLNQEAAHRLHIGMWIFVHGIATMLATAYLDLGDAFISRAMTDAYQGLLYQTRRGMDDARD